MVERRQPKDRGSASERLIIASRALCGPSSPLIGTNQSYMTVEEVSARKFGSDVRIAKDSPQ
jgi:hypothetical protein